MLTHARLFLILSAFILNLGCQKSLQTDEKESGNCSRAPQGTVDGGGGNSVDNPKTGGRVLLDLAEDIDKEPFDFDVRRIIEPLSASGDVSRSNLSSKKIYAYNSFFDDSIMKKIFGSENEFFVWALKRSLITNQEITSGFFDDTTYKIELSAYNLKDLTIVDNVRYSFTDNDLNDVGDTGIMKISNPDTKKQLAAQDENGFVLVNRSEFEKLDENSKIAFKLHESVLYLMIKFNPKLLKEKGTAPIREFVKNLFNYIYVSKVSDTQVIPPEVVRKSFDVLKFPKIIPDYSIIGKISDPSVDPSLVCEFKQSTWLDSQTGKIVGSVNYFFSKNGVPVTQAYSMDIDFIMKIQMYLVKNNICVFKPHKCRLDSYQYYGDKQPYPHYFIDDMPLPEKSFDVIQLSSEVLPKYKTARFCEQ